MDVTIILNEQQKPQFDASTFKQKDEDFVKFVQKVIDSVYEFTISDTIQLLQRIQKIKPQLLPQVFVPLRYMANKVKMSNELSKEFVATCRAINPQLNEQNVTEAF